MSALETGASLALDTKAVSDSGVFEGYASLHGTVDLGRDVVMAGAFTKSLAERPAATVKMLRQHDRGHPVGTWIAMKEDGRGLFVKGQLLLDVQLARETHVLMKAGALDGLSIGFRTKRATHETKSGHRHLHELDLHEISLVTFPMHPDARVSAVKHHDPERARSVVAAIQRATAALR